MPAVEKVKPAIDAVVEQIRQTLAQLNSQIWTNPETAYEEHQTHDAICEFLENEGFQVSRHAFNLQTAFEARSGSGGPLINFNAEYDALPGIGHACGHNLIASSSIAAFISLSRILKTFDIPGRTQLLGTPAEESGGGKVKLIENGAYEGADVSLMAHAGPTQIFPELQSDGIAGLLLNARKELICEFTGKGAHAGGNPWTALNALDALVLAYNNVSVLRQQIHPDDRINCAFLDTPKVANIIPSRTKILWEVRSPTLAGLELLLPRIKNCVEAAALATGCSVNVMEDHLYTDIRVNESLCERFQFHMSRYGRNVTKTFPKVLAGSSDAGNVSYVLPTIHPMFSIRAPGGSFPHHPSFTAAAGTDIAFEEALLVGKSLALTGWDVITDDALLRRVRAQWKKGT